MIKYRVQRLYRRLFRNKDEDIVWPIWKHLGLKNEPQGRERGN